MRLVVNLIRMTPFSYSCSKFTDLYFRETSEGIEMAVISGSSQRPSITPPVQCSSRNSMVDSRESSKRMGKSPTSSADFLDETTASKSKDSHGK